MFYNSMKGFILAASISIVSCQEQSSKKEADTVKSDTNTVNNTSQMTANALDSFNFFQHCENILNHSWLGSLQTVEASEDSLKNIFFASCYDCKETFEIVFFHKETKMRDDQEYQALSKEFHNGCGDYFKNFNCFAFVCPMTDPDKQEDPHAMNIKFPTSVKVYERTMDDKWRFVKQTVTKDFKKFAMLQFKTIYHID
jgi:hypothetical protein